MDNTHVYERLAKHISFLSMGYPPTEALEEILREKPLQPESFANIAKRSDLPENELQVLLNGLAGRGMLFVR
ncbi:MAG: hypothetical protein B6240_03845 [Desulfobacteraceae bacterium 4572_87]|nr:MAG: hypothetical protein B6240_03845 [Desulfobacteraceae bacterium 4572_87]